MTDDPTLYLDTGASVQLIRPVAMVYVPIDSPQKTDSGS